MFESRTEHHELEEIELLCYTIIRFLTDFFHNCEFTVLLLMKNTVRCKIYFHFNIIVFGLFI